MSDAGFMQSSPKKEYTGAQTIRNISAKQFGLIESEESSTVSFLDGVELSTVQIIGWITEVKGTNTGKSFVIEDGSGQVDCTLWPNKPYEEQMASLIEEGVCVKITGTLKVYSNRRCIQVLNLYLLEDYNELTYHLLKVVKQHFFFTKKNPIKHKNNLSLSGIKKDIVQCLKNNQDEDGLTFNEIVKCLGDSYSERVINEHLEMLIDSCFIVKNSKGEFKAI